MGITLFLHLLVCVFLVSFTHFYCTFILRNVHYLRVNAHVHVHVQILTVYTVHVCFVFSAFSDYNTEQFTPAKVGENQVMDIIYEV